MKADRRAAGGGGQSEPFEIADSHAHLDSAEFHQDREAVLERAWAGGIRFLLCPAELTTPESLNLVLELSQKYPWVAAAAGVHPHQASRMVPRHLETIRNLAAEGKIRAIGEIGLDYHYHFSPPSKQKETFRRQLALAQEIALPVVIHSRLSGKDILQAVVDEAFSQGGLLHCFTEDWETAEQMMGLGFFISFSGILTYANAANLREVARRTPFDRILVETDSPYLIPQPFRGKAERNEPLFVIETARVLAHLKQTTLGEIGQTVVTNYRTLFSV